MSPIERIWQEKLFASQNYTHVAHFYHVRRPKLMKGIFILGGIILVIALRLMF